jgi:hypothetical protein
LSLTLVAGIHGSELLEDLDEHKASFAAYRDAIQTTRAQILKPDAYQECHNALANETYEEGDIAGHLWRPFMTDAAQAR